MSSIDESLKESVLTHPFGDLKDPNYITSTNSFFTPLNLINLSIYSIAKEKIFTFESIGDVEIDKNLKTWSFLKRANSSDYIPDIISNEVRLGSLRSIFGYLSGKTNGNDNDLAVASVLASSDALEFFKNDLLINQNFKLSFQVSALDYFQDSLVSNYATPLKFANDLNLTVFTPLKAQEVQHLSILSNVFSQISTSIHLFDGLNYLKESQKFGNTLDLQQNLDLFNKLKSSLKIWESQPFNKRPIVALQTLNSILGTNYQPFEYFGNNNAKKVFVVYGSIESELFINEILSKYSNQEVGVLAIRIPLPFNIENFISTLPKSTENLIIIGQSLDENQSSILKSSIQASIFLNGLSSKIKIEEFIYLPNFIWSSSAIQQIIGQFVEIPIVESTSSLNENFIFWSLDNSELVELASKIAHTLSLDSLIKFNAKFDNLKNGGIYQSQISSTNIIGNISSSDLIYVDNKEILDSFNVTKTVKKGGIVLLQLNELPKTKVNEYLESQVSKSFLQKINENGNKLILIDLSAVPEIPEIKGFQKLISTLSIFWRFANPSLNINDLVRKILVGLGSSVELLPAVLTTIIEEKLNKSFVEVTNDAKWSELEETESLPVYPLETSFKPASIRETIEIEEESNATAELYKRFAFPESYQSSNNLRPDLAIKNFVVKVKENRRVTPADYSRNIFHIEFDISGTGLTYDIGEALGVHARNDAGEVLEFLEFYGLNPDAIVQVPNKEDSNLIELRTLFQSFVENLDLLGKPGKSFYESLSGFATDDKEKEKLKFLSSPEGSSELKIYQDEEFFSYSDILKLFPSAHPSIEELVKLIPTLKRREYSISSSQKLHPNEVHLLIVVVDWIDKRQRKRFGQCSKYLSELKVGSELVVSVKPSVMKLPPLSTQPVIMSGLGTGLAPFKAIIEEKIWQKQQGLEIGEIHLYLGSRHQREEYLYGELWEAYKSEGILTHIGAAFSRDQPEKVYIQDKIRDNIDELSKLVVEKQGVFYLCGPTWPVPDITAVLEDIVANDAKARGVEIDAVREVEEMKENSRYILEVY
ncbi:hypothetical protein WICMUC_002593 [Wickerhamomyces mucosus]|uniref:assimilatory sulfite reductase (NADPH) n=1 Tax=Wickerhamomyces mucosus TaxID=1378264 RepID=A0A9P8TE88_9ASCO|nr:hypothetical protein WICMUC_002593 [Wickerhamomyces mucosus]